MKRSKWKNSLPLSLLVYCCTQTTLVTAHGTTDSAEGSFGDVNFAISCEGEEIQKQFNQGVALIHNMMYQQAEGLFAAATEKAPECSMLYWGIAMSNFHPLWPGLQNQAEFDRGFEAIEKALSLPTSVEKEQQFIDAANAFYSVPLEAKRSERIDPWAAKQQQLFNAYPDDAETTAFFALSHLATAPKSDKTLSHQKTAGLLMEELKTSKPTHPAGFHYLIHAYDNPAFAAKAENVSRAYDSIAPEVPHALHMPSHIFVRMGLWNETVFWNTRSAKAAIEQSSKEMTSMHYAHAMDYMVYAQLQQGDIEAAQTSLAELYAVDNHQDGFAAAYALAAAPARMQLEQEDWLAAAKLPLHAHESISWTKFAFSEPITHFARGIGAARSNNPDLAEESIVELQRLQNELQDFQKGYWAILAESKAFSVKAWKAFANKKYTEAVDFMAKAADLEDSVDKSPVTPGAVLPARELYGDMLQLLNKPSEALVAYEAALSISPGRARSLRGAAKAAESLGKTEKANEYKEFLQAMSSSG